MNISNLTSAHFREILTLLDKKEALQAQIADLERQVGELLESAERGSTAASNGLVPNRPGGNSAERERASQTTKRGELKEAVLTELRNAGEGGMSVKELADKLAVKVANLHAWFGTTGKKIAGLKKIGQARYSLATE